MKSKRYRELNIFDAGIMFLISVIMLMITSIVSAPFVANGLSGGEYYYIVGTAEFLAVALPVIIYMLIRKISIKKIFKGKVSIEMITLSFFLALFSYPIFSFAKLSWTLIVQALNIPTFELTFPQINSVWMLIVATVSVSLIPAFSEELLFRGIMQTQFSKRKKAIAAIALTSMFFMLMHSDITSLTYTYAAGVVIGLIYYYTKSIWTAITFHATINFMGVAATYIISLLGIDLAEQASISAITENAEALLALSVQFIFIIPCAGICVLLFWVLRKVSPKRKETVQDTRKLKTFVYAPYIAGGILLLLLLTVPIVAQLLMR